MTVRANWSYPTRVWLGAGRLAELPAAAAELGMSRPLLVTDPGLARLPVTAADNRVVGIVTHRDIRFEEQLDQPVARVMTPLERLVTVDESASREDVLLLGDKISALASTGKLEQPNDAQVIDGSGATVGALKKGQSITIPPGTLIEFNLTQPCTITVATPSGAGPETKMIRSFSRREKMS